MLKYAVPILHVSNSEAAEDYYCKRLGFDRQFVHRPHVASLDPCYMGLVRDGVRLHLSSFPGDGVSGSVVNVAVEDLDVLHGELVASGVPIDTGPINQTWGTREMYVKDCDGNCLRFIQMIKGQ